jgi:hypothetical protein
MHSKLRNEARQQKPFEEGNSDSCVEFIFLPYASLVPELTFPPPFEQHMDHHCMDFTVLELLI